MSNYWKHKMRGKNPAAIAAMIIFGGAAIIGLAILLGFVIMWLWNWLMPDLFGLSTITYWQAVGLFILAKILIGGCGGRSNSKKRNSDWDCDIDSKKKKKSDFSKWKHYDKFWQEEGDKAYDNYVDKMNQPANTDPSPIVNPEPKPEE
jgi:hypothetical protein